MGNIAIITARGGSKRIPRKNIKIFMGQPMLAYAIGIAAESGIFDEIMVSTEDREIAEIALAHGAKVPFMRSEKNADDFASTADVLLEVISEYEKRDQKFSVFTCIYPCVPFLSGKLLRKAYEKYQSEDCKALMSVARYLSPPQRAMTINENGWLQYREPRHAASRSQDLEPVYFDAGMFYIRDTEDFKKKRKLVITETMPFELPELMVQDIDNPDDWEIAEMKYRIFREKQGTL